MKFGTQPRPTIKFLLGLTAAAMALIACGQPATPSAPVPTRASPPTTLTPAPLPATITPLPPTVTAATAPTGIVTPTLEVTATQASLFPPITAADWQIGPATARVTIIEYGDYQ
jgi:hypothetical protein